MGEVTNPQKMKDSSVGFNPMDSCSRVFLGQELDRLLARFMELVQQVQGSEAMGGVGPRLLGAEHEKNPGRL